MTSAVRRERFLERKRENEKSKYEKFKIPRSFVSLKVNDNNQRFPAAIQQADDSSN